MAGGVGRRVLTNGIVTFGCGFIRWCCVCKFLLTVFLSVLC